MKAFLCLVAITALIGLLYVYVRQQFYSVNVQIEQLRELTRTMALELRDEHDKIVQEPAQLPPPNRLYVVSDDSETEDDETDDESDSDSDVDIKVEELKEVKLEKEIKVEKQEIKVEKEVKVEKEIEKEVEVKVEKEDLNLEELELFDLEDAKVITVDMTTKLDKLSLKELKDLVQEKGGPASLKTKKAMIEFLEKIK